MRSGRSGMPPTGSAASGPWPPALADGERWDLVFNIAEGLTGARARPRCPALLDAFGIPYTFSDPLVMAATLRQGRGQAAGARRGRADGPVRRGRRVAEADAVDLPFPLFVKPVAEGTGKGVSPRSKVGSRAELRSICAELIARYAQPVLVETYLPGRELTVGILGTGEGAWVLGSLEIELLAGAEPEVYSYLNKERCEELVRYRLVRDATAVEAQRVALRAYRALGWPMRAGSTCAATAAVPPCSSRSTRCRACTRPIPTCRSWQPRRGSATGS